MLTFQKIGDTVRCSSFSTPAGCEEVYASIATQPGTQFNEALEDLAASYTSMVTAMRLSDATAVFSRIFLSDLINQKDELVRAPLFNRLRLSGALSVIEQKPLEGGPVSLLSYHVHSEKNALGKQQVNPASGGWSNGLLVKGAHYILLWTANHTSGDKRGTYEETKVILGSLSTLIEQNGMSLHANAIRTWVYVRDIDNQYEEMVYARRKFFSAHGLTEKTRYPASTGILGRTFPPENIVSIDSLSIGGLRERQIVRMEALAHLSPAILYGVTFERGLRIRFGDRSHLHISGTASIDANGDVMHLGDAEAQTRRAIENVRALLTAQGATTDALAYVIAYVRNSHDRYLVQKVLDKEIPEKTPLVFVESAVCRPAWLMELEGLAIVPDQTGFPPYL